MDERSALRVYPYMKPEYMLITNLSRDSIMRNGHPEYIADILTKYIPKETKLVLNADDLISCRVSAGKSAHVLWNQENGYGQTGLHQPD